MAKGKNRFSEREEWGRCRAGLLYIGGPRSPLWGRNTWAQISRIRRSQLRNGFQQQGLTHFHFHILCWSLWKPCGKWNCKGQEWKQGHQLRGNYSCPSKSWWWLTLGVVEINTSGQIGGVFWRWKSIGFGNALDVVEERGWWWGRGRCRPGAWLQQDSGEWNHSLRWEEEMRRIFDGGGSG